MIKEFVKTVGIAVVAGAMFVTLPACEQGPAESVGEKVDNTVEKGGEQMEKAGDNIRDATN